MASTVKRRQPFGFDENIANGVSQRSGGGSTAGARSRPRGIPLLVKVMLFVVVLYVTTMLSLMLSLNQSTMATPRSTSAALKEGEKTLAPKKTRKQRQKAKRSTTRLHYEDSSFKFERNAAEDYLRAHGAAGIRKQITAYIEPPMNDTIPGTGSPGDPDKEGDHGIPPEFVIPLPLRTTTPEDLKVYHYPRFQTCSDLPAKLPIDRGLIMDSFGKPFVWNVGNDKTPPDFPWVEAPYCPVEADPYLPWIHDIFPSVDGNVIEVVAQNKRRCRTGKNFRRDLDRLQPQVSLMQPVSVERIDEQKAQQLAPELWRSTNESPSTMTPRYRLAPFEESAQDGMYTRFICRFYGMQFSGSEPKSVLVGETLSIYPYNYEFVSYRKNKPTLITPKGKDTKYFWASVLRFQCPVPEVLKKLIRNGQTVLSDGTPTVHLDIVPIRTPPRFGTREVYFTEDLAGPKSTWNLHGSHWRELHDLDDNNTIGFDPVLRWGEGNVMPRVEASGRWSNLPICRPPQLPESSKEVPKPDRKITKKPHLLSACLWASASFRTRGKKDKPIQDTMIRLREWIEFHLMVGFDHIYVYDNSGAHSNDTTLEPILSQYPASRVTRIEWPSIVCNNNIPAHDNTGERSSQYAAENSCRTRHAAFTEWIASFDADEYLVPMGNHSSLRDVVTQAQEGKTNILTFRSSRARLMFKHSFDVGDYRDKSRNSTFLEAYNCDSSPVPKPEWGDRARKQIYRADYVPYHFVHYSTVTQGMLHPYSENPRKWRLICAEHAPSERIVDEANEATMLHTKTTTPEQTSRWKKRCHVDFEKKWRGCYVGFPWPDGKENPSHNHQADGMEYNCFPNQKVEDYWAPKLRVALEKRKQMNSNR